MRKSMYAILMLVMGALLIGGCKRHSVNGPANVVNQDDKVIITDQTGTDWDITHAVKEYSMNPDRFQYGLGVGAIIPINNPQFYSPGDAGYPSNDYTGIVVGVKINGDARAYPITVISRHEAVNDRIGDNYFLVGC